MECAQQVDDYKRGKGCSLSLILHIVAKHVFGSIGTLSPEHAGQEHIAAVLARA